jgi:hypothetical protein
MHKGLRGALPEKLKVWLLALRSKWYAMKYARESMSRSGGGRPVTPSAS